MPDLHLSSFRRVFFSSCMLLAFISVNAKADFKVIEVPEEGNFSALAKIMEERKVGLLLEFHAESCPYCMQLEDEFLQPMLRNKSYKAKVVIRKIKMDSGAQVVNFDGKNISASAFASAYKVSLTPTVLFLDAEGQEVAERVVGINTPSLFGAYLDDGIEKALIKIRAESSPSQHSKP